MPEAPAVAELCPATAQQEMPHERTETLSSWTILLRTSCLSICTVLILVIPLCPSADDRDGSAPGTLLELSFESHDAFSSDACRIENHGGEIIPGGVKGNALRLSKNAHISVHSKGCIGKEAGTIMFWVRPHWNHAGKAGGASRAHTFFSFSWDDPRNSYFVISDGWWESSGGREYTYCIFNNQDSVKTEKRILYDQGHWIHLACSWKSGETGFFRSYANGLLTGESYKKPVGSLKPRGNIFLGSDQGTPMADGRWGGCDMDELKTYSHALNDREILSAYLACAPERRAGESVTGITRPLQIRAIFDEETGWMTEQGAREIVDRISRAGFNMYVPCIWHGKGTRFPSSLAPPESGLSFSGKDPLKRLIDLAHERDIEVHPWFCVTLRQRDFLNEFFDEGTPENAFNIHDPRFREFMISLILDVVARYDVDGINLDYIRSLGICTSDFCQRQYEEMFSRNLLVDMEHNSKERGLEPHIQRWIDSAVEKIVQDISCGGKRLKPGLIVSVDGCPLPRYLPPSGQGRQEVRWANKGYINIIFHMDYRMNPDLERVEFIKAELKQPEKLIPLLGNYERNCAHCRISSREAGALFLLVSRSLITCPYGFGIYTYSRLNDDQIDALSPRTSVRAGLP